MLQLGAMALSTVIAPSIGILDGHNVHSSETFLQAEGLTAWGALYAAGYYKLRHLR